MFAFGLELELVLEHGLASEPELEQLDVESMSVGPTAQVPNE